MLITTSTIILDTENEASPNDTAHQFDYLWIVNFPSNNFFTRSHAGKYYTQQYKGDKGNKNQNIKVMYMRISLLCMLCKGR